MQEVTNYLPDRYSIVIEESKMNKYIHHPVHKSDIIKVKRCPKQWELEVIHGIRPSFVNESSIAGTALHDTIMYLHRHYPSGGWSDDIGVIRKYFNIWVELFHEGKEKYLKRGIEINTVEDIRAERYMEMLAGYMSKPYNRYAKSILLESEFYFEIRRGRAVYDFKGRIDQLLQIGIKYLKDFDMIWPYDKDYIYIHRDLKSGKKHGTSSIMLEMDDNVNVYSYGLAFGNFDVNNDGICEQRISLIPYCHAIYYLEDCIPYKKSGTTKSGRTYHAGDDRGMGMYVTYRNYHDLKLLEEELICTWKQVNSGNYPRIGLLHNMCDQYCGVKNICLKQLKGEL